MSDKVVLNHPEIVQLIPHRPPFLMIDSVNSLVAHESARGVKAIASTDPHLAGHFPGFPIMPGVLIVEAMAQTAGVLCAWSNREETEDKHVYLTTIDKVKFRSPARPGDTLFFDVKCIGSKGMLFRFDGIASIDGKTVTTASFSAMMVDPGR
jgi:3-hydroxyacyl-[acyl-carrier-protein] dehydratase